MESVWILSDKHLFTESMSLPPGEEGRASASPGEEDDDDDDDACPDEDELLPDDALSLGISSTN